MAGVFLFFFRKYLTQLLDFQILRKWLSFSLRRNPSVLPLSLERLADVPRKQPHRQEDFSMDREGFTDVGGATQHTLDRRVLKLDECTRSSIGPMISVCVITDGDLAKIRQAATSIIQEEASFGRWIHAAAMFFLVGQFALNLTQ